MANDEKDPRDANRRVLLPQAGPGVYLALTNAGIRSLYNKHGAEWHLIVEKGLLLCDVDIMTECFSLMAREADGSPSPVQFDDMDNLSLADLSNLLCDAFSLSMNGRRFMEQVEWLKEQEQAAKAKAKADAEAKDGEENPMTGQVDSTPGSDESPTEPASSPPNSTP